MSSLATAALTAAPAQASPRDINVPAGSLESALTALAAQTGEQLVYAPEIVAGRRAPALAGRFETEQALTRLLANSDIRATRAGPKVIVLKAGTSGWPASAAAPNVVRAGAPAQEARPFVDAAPNPGADLPVVRDPGIAPTRPTAVEEVKVTGTRIRGGSPAAPVLVLDRVTLERSGYATVAQALQALPQNFGGESTESTNGAVRADRQNSNSGYANGINLRGLGSDSTLVLVNGRRLGGSGNKGDFSDISSLPAIAVERVEVLLDGASALYGSDAVGGVVNIILRKNFQGGEVRVRGGTGEHGPDEGLVAATFGHNWSTGNVLVAYEAYQRDRLPASARRYSASSDLRSLGGTDHRDTFSFPGNVVRTDPVTGGIVPFWGVPPGQSGVGLRPTDFQAGVINRFNQNAGVDVLPEQRRQSAYLALRQAVTPDFELTGDARYGFRRVKVASSGATSTLTVGRNNPFFVSPNGTATNQIQYAFLGLVGPRFTHAGVQSLSTSLGGELKLPGDWRANGYAAFAQEIIESTQSEGVNSLVLAEALGNAPDNPLTPYSPSRDGFFNPYSATTAGNSATTLAAISSGFTKTRYRSNVESADFDADGTMFHLPGGAAKLAVGVQARRETFLNTGSSFSSQPAPIPLTTFDAHRKVAAAYAEVRIPLIGPDNARPGLASLDLSGALRAEHYSDFGRTVNPRVSVEWSPMSGVKLRGTYGESFRAPALVELYGGQVYSQLAVPLNGQTVRTLAKQGSNPDLGPETATSWTFGIDIAPAALPGLRLAATWFETDFENRIDRPLASAPRASILTDPRLAPFVQRITPATSAADLALINRLLADPLFNASQGVFLPTEYVAVTDLRYVNTSGLKVRGIDMQAAYGANALGGRLTFTANASWMLDYKQALTPAAPFADLVGLATFPAKFRGRLTTDWSRDPFTLGLALNHLSGAKDSLGTSIGSQTTVDLHARVETSKASWTHGVALALSIRNLFDKAPPFYDNPIGLGYDATNADVIGRFVSLQISRSW